MDYRTKEFDNTLCKLDSSFTEKKWLSIREFMLLFDLDAETVYVLIENQEIDFYNPFPGLIYFYHEDIHKWISGNKYDTFDNFIYDPYVNGAFSKFWINE